ncbi:hypothetical protein Tco_1394003 [Tanacetum coccineum]
MEGSQRWVLRRLENQPMRGGWLVVRVGFWRWPEGAYKVVVEGDEKKEVMLMVVVGLVMVVSERVKGVVVMTWPNKRPSMSPEEVVKRWSKEASVDIDSKGFLEFFVCPGLRQGVEDLREHRGLKQVGFNKLGPGVETGVHGVHDEKRVWFEVELRGAQGDREAEVFQVYTTMYKSDVAKHLGVAGIQQQNRLVNETNVTLFAKVRCFLIQSGLSKVFWAEDTTMSTYLVNRSSSSAIGFKTPVDMLGFFGWLNSIKQGMLEPVKVKCIFLGYHKCIVGNKLWRLDDVTSKVLQGVEFEVEPHEDHTFEVEPQKNVDHVVGSQEVQTQDLIYYHSNHVDRKHSINMGTIQYREDSNEKDGLKDDMDAQSDAYVLSNDCRKCSDDSDGYYWEYTPGMFIHLFLYIDDVVFSCGCKAEIWATKGLLGKAKGNALSMKIVRDQSGSIDGLHEGLDIASADVGSLKANLQHMEALSTTEAGYMTFTEAWKKEIWLKGLLTESGYELRLVAGIATGALVKGCSRSEVPAQVKVVAYRY